MKLNFDAAFWDSEHKSSSRMVMRDSGGQVLDTNVVLNDNIPSSFAAEALACAQSLQWVLALGYKDLIVKGDSLTVINKINRVQEDKSLIGAYIRDCKQMGEFFHICLFRHISRSANKVAHMLAMESLKQGIRVDLQGSILELTGDDIRRDAVIDS